MSATILKQSDFSKASVFFSALALLAACFVLPSIFMLSAAAQAATINVNSLADPGAAGICALRDAISAANTMTATNGCAAGDGNDTIQFSVTGTILLASTLPEVTDSQLTINGPASPGITISGGGKMQVMQIASGATVSFNNLTIIDGIGQPDAAAGGIVNQGNLTLTNSTLSGNSGGEAEHGAGAIVNQATLAVINTTISDNNGGVEIGDGGILNQGTLTVTNSLFSGNLQAFEVGGDGAIDNLGTLTVTNSTFSDNHGDGPGGIDNAGTATVMSSTFSNNSSGYNGGEAGGAFSNGNIFSSTSARASITNSTFSGNSGVFIFGSVLNGVGSTVAITNSTIVGGTYNIANFGVASLNGTILAGARFASCAPAFTGEPTGVVAITDLGYNISDDDSCGFTATGSLNNTDPMLDPAGLSNNGGPTQTIPLVPGSPAIDAIPVASCTDQSGTPLTSDQRGFPRPDAGEDVCDIGAYESQDNTTPPAVRITVPATGTTVSGKVSIVAKVSAAVSWIDVYIDGIYLTSSPPYSFTWDTSSVATGSHTISATAFDNSSTVIGTSSITVSVDNTSPTAGVTITAPANGVTVSGNVIIATQVGTEVSWIDVYIDRIYLTSSPPYSFTWNSASVPDGSHTISATAFDSSGTAIGGSSPVTVTVNNNLPTSAVTITAPADHATVSGNVTIATQVKAGVSWIDVYIDGNYLASSPPDSFSWDSSSVANGSHTISATAFDSSGAAIRTSSITVVVNNAVTITAPADGATVSGGVIIATKVSTEVTWIDVYVDGNYLASSPPYSFAWNSASVPDGSHTISATAFAYPDTAIGASSITVNVAN